MQGCPSTSHSSHSVVLYGSLLVEFTTSQWHHLALVASQITGSLNICSTTFYAGVSKYILWFTLCGALWLATGGVYSITVTSCDYIGVSNHWQLEHLFNNFYVQEVGWGASTSHGSHSMVLYGWRLVGFTALQWHHVAIITPQITGNLTICSTTSQLVEADTKKQKSSTLLAFLWWNPGQVTGGFPYKGPVMESISMACCHLHSLTHWGQNKMAAISRTTFWNAFSWMKILEFRIQFDWSLFLRVQLTII